MIQMVTMVLEQVLMVVVLLTLTLHLTLIIILQRFYQQQLQTFFTGIILCTMCGTSMGLQRQQVTFKKITMEKVV